MNALHFIVLNFFVGFFSDIVLNVTNIVTSLKSYFTNKTIIESAIYAGITIVCALIVTMFLSDILFHFAVPNNLQELMKFSALAFFIGYISDYFIYYMHVFGNRLDLYYKTLGIGFWGAMAFLFSILISYFIQKYIIPDSIT